jgi:hypothetical protein
LDKFIAWYGYITNDRWKGRQRKYKIGLDKVAKLPMCDPTCEELLFHIWRTVTNDTYRPKIEPV